MTSKSQGDLKAKIFLDSSSSRDTLDIIALTGTFSWRIVPLQRLSVSESKVLLSLSISQAVFDIIASTVSFTKLLMLEDW